jgi:hypothetical protein
MRFVLRPHAHRVKSKRWRYPVRMRSSRYPLVPRQAAPRLGAVFPEPRIRLRLLQPSATPSSCDSLQHDPECSPTRCEGQPSTLSMVRLEIIPTGGLTPRVAVTPGTMVFNAGIAFAEASRADGLARRRCRQQPLRSRCASRGDSTDGTGRSPDGEVACASPWRTPRPLSKPRSATS